jgi:hypothetical protein
MATGQPYNGAEWWTPETQAVDELTAVINRTVSVTGLPVQWAKVGDDDKSLCDSYNYLKVMPYPLWDAWVNAIAEVDEPPGDPETAPPETLPDSKKKKDAL